MRSKILTFGKAKKYFVFPSLNRTFEHTFEGTCARQSKLKTSFYLFCAHLFVPLNIRSKVLTLDKAN